MPYSTDDIIHAIEQRGWECKSGRGKRGSHRTWARLGAPGELHVTVTLVLGAKEIPAGTLAAICRQLGIDKVTLEAWIRGE